MKTFTYTITDSLGIHARPAGMLAKTGKGFESKITIEKDGKVANVCKLLAVMGLVVKCGDTVKITVSGADEDTAVKEMEKFFADNL